MGYWINKAVWFIASPLNVAILLIVVGAWLSWREDARKNLVSCGRRLVLIGTVLLLLFSFPVTGFVLGYGLERNYEERSPNDVPDGDVVLDLCGSWRRAWYAAEIVKAGRARYLIASGARVERLDAKLIRDLGVSEPDLVLDVEARNTEENVKNAKEIVGAYICRVRPRILVVTTAVHMLRSMLLMNKYWPEAEAIPVPTEFWVRGKDSEGIKWSSFIPSLSALQLNLAFYHEYLGYVAYRWLKR